MPAQRPDFPQWLSIVYPRLKRRFGRLGGVSFCRDGTRLRFSSGQLYGEWDLIDGKPLIRVQNVECRDFYRDYLSPDGATVLVLGTSMNGRMLSAYIGDAVTGAPSYQLRTGLHDISCAQFIAPSRMVTGCEEGGLRLWDTTADTFQELPSSHEDEVMSLAISPDGRTLISACRQGIVQKTDLAAGTSVVLAAEGHDITDCTLSPDGLLLACLILEQQHGLLYRVLKVRSLENGAEHFTMKVRGSYDGLAGITFTPDSKELVVGHNMSRTVQILAADRGTLRLSLDEPQGARSTACSPDGRLLAYACGDGTIRLADLRNGTFLARLCMFTNGSWIVLATDGRFDSDDRLENSSNSWGMHPKALQPLPDPQSIRKYLVPGLLARVVSGG